MRKQLYLLREAARKNHPVEACALLFGKMVNNEATITKVVAARNILQSTVRFEMNPQTVFKAFEQADREGIEFIGLFHSHPAPASPSTVDIHYMRLLGKAIWLILSSVNGSLAAFQMVDGEVREITIKVE